MEIKQATAINLVDILFLLKQCIRSMHQNGQKQWNEENPSTDQIKKFIEDGTLYLAMDIGIAKGMINLTAETPEDYDQIEWKSNSDKVLYIKYFAVHPLWQDVEIGYQLLDFAEKFAKDNGYTSIRLDVLDSYPVDEKFISNLNFSLAGNFHSEFQKKPYACFEKTL